MNDVPEYRLTMSLLVDFTIEVNLSNSFQLAPILSGMKLRDYGCRLKTCQIAHPTAQSFGLSVVECFETDFGARDRRFRVKFG